MYTIILYVALCTSPDVCDQYEPASWTVQAGTANTQQEEDQAFKECAALERVAMSVKGYKESDCYIAE